MSQESIGTEFIHLMSIIAGTSLAWIFIIDKAISKIHPMLSMMGTGNQIIGVESPSGLMAVIVILLIYNFDRKRRNLEGLKLPQNQ